MSAACGQPSADTLANWVIDAHRRTVDLVADLSDEQLMGPQLEIVNALLWEIGHVAWFQEKWVLRHVAGRLPAGSDVDDLYNSAAVAHDRRWDLPLPSRQKTMDYLHEVRNRVLDVLDQTTLSKELAYFVQLVVFHEDMHTEAFTYTRQTLGYPPPRFHSLPEEPYGPPPADIDRSVVTQDVEIGGGRFYLGASQDGSFVFDNEKWAHPVDVRPFAIARTAVTQGQFAEFVLDGGYARKELWSDEGWAWRSRAAAQHPVYWRLGERGDWWRRNFDQWVPLEENCPVIHVNWYEAQAYCRWFERRLPTEAEWELAAAGGQASEPHLAALKPRFAWGNDAPTPARANLDWHRARAEDVAALAEGDSPYGCRQMIGNVWEWTADRFLPYPGFVADPYREYSQPWFGSHRVLRGGCWATRGRLIRNTWRNFYQPDRRDVWAGFRTCALGE